MSVTYLNKHFRFVYQPKQIELFQKSKRFLVDGGSISKYIGTENANKVILTALNSKTDKVTLKFRKYGKIEIYVK